MLKTIIFLSIIVKLAFGEEVIDDIDEEEMSMTMDVFEALATCEIDDSDELTPIEAEVAKRCKEITKKSVCLRATSGLEDNKQIPGIELNRKPNRGNDGPGECVYIKSKRNKVVKRLGYQCIAPAEVKKTLRRIRKAQQARAATTTGPPPAEEIMAVNGLMSASEGTQFDINYIIATVAVIGLLISFGAYYKCKNNGKTSSITSSERTSLYQSV